MSTKKTKKNETIEVNNWDQPEVKVRKQGGERLDMHRFVKTTGDVHIPCDNLLPRITELLRQGKRVILGDGDIMLYPLVNAEMTGLKVSAKIGSELAKCLADKTFKVLWKGREVNGKNLAKQYRNDIKENRKHKTEVTPDTIVECPNCGTSFRIGKRIAG